jgi:hypothetical protein
VDGGKTEVEGDEGQLEGDVDAAIVVVTSLDGKRKLILGWTPGKSILTNRAIPCAHADPFYGELKIGESRNVLGVVRFTEKPLEEAIGRFIEEGIGLPPHKVFSERLKEIQEYGT